MMKQIGHKSVVHLTVWDACSKRATPLPVFLELGHNKWATLFGFNQCEKRVTRGIWTLVYTMGREGVTTEL
jgi:hypothetical protein